MGLFGKKKKDELKWQEAVLTLYACRGETDSIPGKIQEAFAQLQEGFSQVAANHFEVSLKDGSAINLYITSDPSETAVQADGMANFFLQAQLDNQEVRAAALTQIRLFNCIVGIEFQVNEDSARTNAVVNAVYRLAEHIVAFVLHPNMSLYHSDGRLLISIDGRTDFESFSPVGDASLLDKGRAEETQADKDRKARSIAVCKAKGIPFIEHLRAAVYESECRIPSKEDILHRAAAVFAACVYAEVHTSGQYEEPKEAAKEMTEELDKRYGINAWLSPKEQAYLEGKLDDAASHNRFGWRYECCAVLLWALSLYELGDPDEICDASKLGAIMWNNDFDSLMEKAQLRSKEELLDRQDLIFRYDWACVDARIHGKELTAVSGDIVYEWHYALNWLVGAEGITDWDGVRTTT